MKHKPLLILVSLLFISLTASECKKHKPPSNPVDQLPPETQIGANTFGCLINGEVFLPKGGGINPVLTCYYQYIYYPSPVGYVFQVKANNKSDPSFFQSINILVDSLKLIEGNTYNLQESIRGRARGNYVKAKTDNTSYDNYFTYFPSSGELVIKRFDEINQIASGTFWFNAVNSNGDTIHVTDGRFDMQFTK
jgi:hypothetical protein